MSSYVFDYFKGELLKGTVALSGSDNDFYIALVNTSAFATDQTDISAWSQVSATWDIGVDATKTSTGYTSGFGAGLSGTTVSASYGRNESQWHASDQTWSTSNIDADGAIIYRISDSLMICAIDFVTEQSSSNADFTVSWNAQGIINLG